MERKDGARLLVRMNACDDTSAGLSRGCGGVAQLNGVRACVAKKTTLYHHVIVNFFRQKNIYQIIGCVWLGSSTKIHQLNSNGTPLSASPQSVGTLPEYSF